MIFDILLIISSYLALFYSVILFFKENKHVSDYYLAAWLVVLFIYISGQIPDSLFFKEITSLISHFHNVFLFLYVKQITTKSKVRDIFYFLPFLILIPLFLMFDLLFLKILISLLSCLFLMGTYVLLLKYKQNLAKNYSNIEYGDRYWLNLLFYGSLFFNVVHLFSLILYPLPEKSINAITFFVFMNITGVKAILQHLNFIVRPANETLEMKESVDYTSYGLKEVEAKILAEKLKHSMEVDKLYLNQELNLKDLAENLNVYPHYITQVLSTILNQNFYDFVNSYRVEEAKLRLADPQNANLTIIAIAFDCGFNSKTAFNRAFKQKTDITPSQYKRSL